jgi:SAM-dependent methyltransferase
MNEHVSPYDAIAEFYQSAWAGWYLPSVLPALERLFFPALQRGAAVLDVCCGCGHITAEIAARGFQVTGLDASRELVERARQLTPNCTFVVADARNFALQRQFDGALSTFDSLNHLLTYAELRAAFECVRRALKPGAPFFFDMNLEEAYSQDLGSWTRLSADGQIGFVRGRYHATSRRAQTEIICFFEDTNTQLWRRADAVVEEQCYSPEEIRCALLQTGFQDPELYRAAQAGVTDELGFGRIYVRAWA